MTYWVGKYKAIVCKSAIAFLFTYFCSQGSLGNLKKIVEKRLKVLIELDCTAEEFFPEDLPQKKKYDEVFEKMNKMALENKFTGFERSDLNFILVLYQQFYIFILYSVILIGIFILIILFRKKIYNKKIMEGGIAMKKL